MTQKNRILTSLASGKELSAKQLTSMYKIASVSYTHLTLPTICSV